MIYGVSGNNVYLGDYHNIGNLPQVSLHYMTITNVALK